MHRPNFAHQAQQIAHQHMVQAQQKRQHDGGHYVYEQIARRKAAERNARLTRRPDEIRPRTNSTAVMVAQVSQARVEPERTHRLRTALAVLGLAAAALGLLRLLVH